MLADACIVLDELSGVTERPMITMDRFRTRA